jgi:hypothetical protein
MRAFTFTAHIDRPPQVVWDTLVDLTLSSKWRPLIATMETTDGKPLALGSDVRIVVDVLGTRQTRVSKVVAFEPLRRWTLKSQGDGIDGIYSFNLAPGGSGTDVEFTGDLIVRRFTRYFVLPLIARSEKRIRGEQLPAFKRLVEQR